MAARPVARLTRQRMQRNFEIQSNATDAGGVRLEVVKAPMPRLIERRLFPSAAGGDPYT